MSELKEEIRLRLLYAISNLVDKQDLERAVESMYNLIDPCPADLERWRPSQGDEYFKIDSDGLIYKIAWNEDDLDLTFWAFGNCFQTRAQAEIARAQIKELLLKFHQHGEHTSV